VNEVYLRLVEQSAATWNDRAHFFAVAAQLMRRILVDHARAHRAEKRGGQMERVQLDEARDVGLEEDLDLVALDDALKDLAQLDPRQARVVELKFFGGLNIDETAEVLGVSSATVTRDWRYARAWLVRQLRHT
jgi:RNA polymerase sigma factor (TIGR02999 family)